MTQDLHSNGNPDDDDFDDVLPKCPECGGELKYSESPVLVSDLTEDDEPMFMVDVCCEACEYGCGIFVTALDDCY